MSRRSHTHSPSRSHRASRREPPAPKALHPTSLGAADDYLFDVYKRADKIDNKGDFSAKDPLAAQRVGLDTKAFVIQGMRPELRELLYQAGKAMDADGINWSISAGFRDDFRQKITDADAKARIGYSLHGGSRRTKGFGDGQAVDITGTPETPMEDVWDWIDKNGKKYGLTRPMKENDPPHIQMNGDASRLAAQFKGERLIAEKAAAKNPPAMVAQANRNFADAANRATQPAAKPEENLGIVARAKKFFWQAMEVQGKAMIAEAEMMGGRPVPEKTTTAEGVGVTTATLTPPNRRPASRTRMALEAQQASNAPLPGAKR